MLTKQDRVGEKKVYSMPRKLELCAFEGGEEQQLRQISRSRAASQHVFERARMVLLFNEGRHVADIAQAGGRSPATISYLVHQFNDCSLAFVDNLPHID